MVFLTRRRIIPFDKLTFHNTSPPSSYLWLGSVPGRTFPNATWTIVGRKCGPQNDSNDCGVSVATCAASVVLETSIPTRVDDFRAVMAAQVLERVKGTRLDWDVVKIFLLGLGDDERDDAVEGLGDKFLPIFVDEAAICSFKSLE